MPVSVDTWFLHIASDVHLAHLELFVPEPTARSAFPGVIPGGGYKFRTAIYTRGRSAQAKSKVYQISQAHGYGSPFMGGHPHRS